MANTRVLIMAAGEGKRMQSSLPKVLHRAHGKAMIDWVLEAARMADPHPVVIVGHGRDQLVPCLKDVDIAVQAEQKGTGHAVMMANAFIPDDGYVVVMAGDMPLLRGETVLQLAETAASEGAAACVLTAILPDATGYGRVIRDEEGKVLRIVEHKDANEEERAVREINTSVYAFDAALLKGALSRLTDNNAQHEYYLTDVIGLLNADGHKVTAMAADAEESSGVNDRVQLAAVSAALRRRVALQHMKAGVELIDPERTVIESGVTIGRDTVIWPDNVLQAGTVIGENCTLLPGNRIAGTRIGSGCTLEASILEHTVVADGSRVGPFAHRVG